MGKVIDEGRISHNIRRRLAIAIISEVGLWVREQTNIGSCQETR